MTSIEDLQPSGIVEHTKSCKNWECEMMIRSREIEHSLSETIATPIGDLPDGGRGSKLNKFE